MFDMLEVIFCEHPLCGLPAYPTCEQHSMATVRGCCRFIGFSVNSTRSLLRSGLPAFGTTTAYPLRVEVGFLEMPLTEVRILHISQHSV